MNLMLLFYGTLYFNLKIAAIFTPSQENKSYVLIIIPVLKPMWTVFDQCLTAQ